VIRVGGATEVEVKERKDRVDDAMHATRAAVEEGIVPGGGVALLRASEHLKGLRTKNDDQKTGVEIVRKALSYPARQIAINAGEDDLQSFQITQLCSNGVVSTIEPVTLASGTVNTKRRPNGIAKLTWFQLILTWKYFNPFRQSGTAFHWHFQAAG